MRADGRATNDLDGHVEVMHHALDHLKLLIIFLSKVGTIRLHHILRSDEDRHHHDHPFSFLSLILSGGYVEHRPGHEPTDCPPGTLVFRKAEELHKLELRNGDAWTLVVSGPIRRQWGFHTEAGWISAPAYFLIDWAAIDKLSARRCS